MATIQAFERLACGLVNDTGDGLEVRFESKAGYWSSGWVAM